jgi:ParB family chromosome partitioning protein
MQTHELKSWPEYFAMVASGDKTFELRKNDRNFKVGDKLRLEEFRPHVGTYTGRTQTVVVTYMIDSKDTIGMDGLRDGYCVLGIRLV